MLWTANITHEDFYFRVFPKKDNEMLADRITNDGEGKL